MLVTPRLAGAVGVLALLAVRAVADAQQVLRSPDDDSQGVDLFGAHLRAAVDADDLTVDHNRAALVGAHDAIACTAGTADGSQPSGND
jgi:hypothetical protein